LQDITTGDFYDMLATNLGGAFNMCKAVVPHMISAKRGRIINISSVLAEGGSCESHYCASKAGLIGLTKALAKELAPSGITVNAVSPGLTDTEMIRDLSKEELDATIKATALGRIGTPEDVAAAVFFIASDEASFISGQNLTVDGILNI
jgi:3-oxoacyl-[acyl-carrier protein] reductase